MQILSRESERGRRRDHLEAATLNALHELAIASGTRGLQAVACLAADHVRAMLAADGAVIFGHDAEHGILRPVGETDSPVPEQPLEPGEGAIGLAFETCMPVIVADYGGWPNAVPSSAARGMTSAIAVPLVAGERAIGALGVWTYGSRDFSAEEEQVLMLFATQLAPALETARLNEQRDESARIFEALHQVAVAAGGMHDPAEVGHLCIDQACRLLRADGAVLLACDGGRENLLLLADNLPSGAIPPEMGLGDGAAGMAFQGRGPVVVNDYQAWPHGLPIAVERGVRSALCVPLVVGDHPVGVVAVISLSPREFTRRDSEVLTLLASQIAPALEAARLIETSASQLRELRALHDTAPVAIARHDLAGALLWLNHAGRDMFRLAEGGTDQGSLSALMLEEDGAGEQRLLEELVAGRIDRCRLTRRCVRGDGTWFWGDVTYSLVRTEDGRPDFYFSMIDDVSERVEAEVALRASEARKSAVLESALDCVIGADERGMVIEFNPAAERVFQRSRRRTLGRPLAEILSLPDGFAAGCRFEARGIRADGSFFPAEVSAGSFEQGERPMLSLAVRDLSEQRRAEAARRESEDRFRAVFDRAAIGLARLSLKGGIIEANPALYRMLGQLQGTLVGVELHHLVHPDDRKALRLDRLAAGEASEHQAELRYVQAQAGEVWGNTIVSVVRDVAGAPLFLILMVEDITLRKANEFALEHRALHDPLTDLPNRTLLQDRLHLALARGRRERAAGALLLVDLDGFKQVNDAHGHHAGDLLLKQIAARMRGGLRGSDTVARLGGDEFAIVLPDVRGRSGAIRAASKLLAALEQPFHVAGHQERVSASVGIALFPTHANDADRLLRQADAAMYAAKRAGTGAALYDPRRDAVD